MVASLGISLEFMRSKTTLNLNFSGTDIMASVKSLTDYEISIIKGMFLLNPRLSKQAIHAFFTKPGRDFNQARISDIENNTAGMGRPHIQPASEKEVRDYMARVEWMHRAFNYSPWISTALYFGNGTPLAQIDLDWWPVGQGLFSSGRLLTYVGGEFSWVYDCGSLSGAKERDQSIEKFQGRNGDRPIDLLVLSHFDNDHINGIVKLVSKIEIRTLLLPYLPLWERLLIMLDEGIAPGDPLVWFFVNPVAYLTEVGEGRIQQIVFVSPTGPDDTPTEDAGGEFDLDGPVEPGEADRPIMAKIEEGKPPSEYENNPIKGTSETAGSSKIEVKFLQRGGRVILPALWEFVPYNDAELLPHVSAHFETAMRKLANDFIAKQNDQDRMKTLKELKTKYEKAFSGKNKKELKEKHNQLSLFLYSGPIGSRIKLAHYRATHHIHFNDQQDNFAQLYTGDGYLDTQDRFNALQGKIHNSRLERAGILQVMHHGSEKNWYKGIARILSPAVSIFSSDPTYTTYGHPDADVLRDFWPWCPVQVDRQNGFHFSGCLIVS
jgi:beta-lactamase superfamily II metal-dependent hydrolase